MFGGGRGRGRKPKPPPDPYARIAELVVLACEGGGVAPDPELLRALKREVRLDGTSMRRAHETLLDRCLRHKECGPRRLAVVIVDELFCRSQQFRDMHMERLDAFIRRACVGNDSSGASGDPAEAMPGPAEDADALVSRAVHALEGWTERFATHYPRLTIALRYVNDTLGPAAPASRAEHAAREALRRNAVERSAVLARWARCQRETLPGLRRDVGECTVGIGECLEMLIGARPTKEGVDEWDRAGHEAIDGDAEDEEKWEDVEMDDDGNPSGDDTAVDTARAPPPVDASAHAPNVTDDGTIKIIRTEDNGVIVDELKALCAAASLRLIPGLAAALALLAKIQPTESMHAASNLESEAAATTTQGLDAEGKAAAVNALARAKRTLRAAVDRCVELGVDFPPGPDVDDDAAVNDGTAVNDVDDAEGAALTIALDDVPALPAGESTGDDDGVGVGVSDIDALLERARRRRAWREGLARRNAQLGGRGGRGTNGGGGRGTNANAGGTDSVANRAKRMLASRMREHNEEVMREIGDAMTERRDEASGLAETRRRLERERETREAAEVEGAAREAAMKRRKETTPRQRIEAKLKALKRKRR
jgi:hypothetical protein